VLILAQIDGFLICVRLTLAFVDGWCSERVTFGAGQAFHLRSALCPVAENKVTWRKVHKILTTHGSTSLDHVRGGQYSVTRQYFLQVQLVRLHPRIYFVYSKQNVSARMSQHSLVVGEHKVLLAWSTGGISKHNSSQERKIMCAVHLRML
jgi:hypothetical protein